MQVFFDLRLLRQTRRVRTSNVESVGVECWLVQSNIRCVRVHRVSAYCEERNRERERKRREWESLHPSNVYFGSLSSRFLVSFTRSVLYAAVFSSPLIFEESYSLGLLLKQRKPQVEPSVDKGKVNEATFQSKSVMGCLASRNRESKHSSNSINKSTYSWWVAFDKLNLLLLERKREYEQSLSTGGVKYHEGWINVSVHCTVRSIALLEKKEEAEVENKFACSELININLDVLCCSQVREGRNRCIPADSGKDNGRNDSSIAWKYPRSTV